MSCWWFPCLLWLARVSCFDYVIKLLKPCPKMFVFLESFNASSSLLNSESSTSQLFNGKAETLIPCDTCLLQFFTDFPIDFPILSSALSCSDRCSQLYQWNHSAALVTTWAFFLLLSLVLWLTTILLVLLLVILLFIYIQWFLLWTWGTVSFLKANGICQNKLKLLQFAHCSCNILATKN